MILHILSTTFGLATAIASGFAAYYWLLSSKVDPQVLEPTTASISDAPEMHILDAQVGLIHTHVAFRESSRLNKIAATWSGVAAALGAVTALLSAF